MTEFLVTVLLLCLLKYGMSMATAWDDEDFFRYCPPSRCSKHGPEIRFPFWLESSNTSSLCGAPGLKLACSGQDTILVYPAYAPYIVTAIDYRSGTLTLSPRVRVGNSSPSCRQKLMSGALPRSTVDYRYPDRLFCIYAVIISCLTELTPSNRDANYIYGPISCLSNTTNFSYLVAGYAYLYVLPLLDCRVVPDSFFLMTLDLDGSTFKEKAEGILNFSETTMTASYYCFPSNIYGGVIVENCRKCELNGRRCGFNPQRNQTFCMNHAALHYFIGIENNKFASSARHLMLHHQPDKLVEPETRRDANINGSHIKVIAEWIFEKVISGQELAAREMTGEEKEKVKQLAIVALWCIQWNPRNRPSMTKVVNMLTGRLENLQMPPKPFVSSESREMP
ncbi:hypothetical protein C2845_PM07G13150 [Panicum miliaceum]|uniref:RING-type E3 ubiquitin transferase n=1 Tax=Panicum miliaceum TaxID=4540 RepID=A0A3L6SPA1_PANMI|nr:hypothetical protein C2845_PM07G13150 [Panicum miliaceum]